MDESLPTLRLAQVAGHARGCPTCSHETQVARAALRAADSPLAWLRALLTPGTRLWIPAPVLAGATVMIVVLAWVGLSPRLAPDVFEGGALPYVFLEVGTRGATPAEIRVDPSSPYHLLVVQLDSSSLSRPTSSSSARILDVDGREAWSAPWDPDVVLDQREGVITLLVPTRVLVPGRHLLQLLADEHVMHEIVLQVGGRGS